MCVCVLQKCEFEQQKASLIKRQFLSTSPVMKTSHSNRREITALSDLRMYTLVSPIKFITDLTCLKYLTPLINWMGFLFFIDPAEQNHHYISSSTKCVCVVGMMAPEQLSFSPCLSPSSEGSEVMPWSGQNTRMTPELYCALQLPFYCRCITTHTCARAHTSLQLILHFSFPFNILTF